MEKIKNFLNYTIYGCRLISYIIVIISTLVIKVNRLSFLDVIGYLCVLFLSVCVIFIIVFLVDAIIDLIIK